jgi:hypothetical protein
MAGGNCIMMRLPKYFYYHDQIEDSKATTAWKRRKGL